MTRDHPAGVVLTGGGSRRMGTDKATMVVDGKPLVVRVADALWEASCHPVECQGGDVVAIAAHGIESLPDTRPGDGPVAAIHDALARNGTTDVVAAACDLVDIGGDTIRSLIDVGNDSDDAEVVVAATGEDRHLLAWWRSGTADRLGVLLDAGVRSYREALAQLRTVDVQVDPATVRNLNTPTDVDARG